MSVHADGRATVSNREGESALQVALGKPHLVEDAISRETGPVVDPAMAHGAKRAFATIRESITDGTCETLGDVLTLAVALEMTYESFAKG